MRPWVLVQVVDPSLFWVMVQLPWVLSWWCRVHRGQQLGELVDPPLAPPAPGSGVGWWLKGWVWSIWELAAGVWQPGKVHSGSRARR